MKIKVFFEYILETTEEWERMTSLIHSRTYFALPNEADRCQKCGTEPIWGTTKILEKKLRYEKID